MYFIARLPRAHTLKLLPGLARSVHRPPRCYAQEVPGRPTPSSESPARRHSASPLALAASTLLALGCASPGPPRPPSLQIPPPVADLAASREGDVVVVRFTLPQRTTDNLPLRPAETDVTLCRGPELATCVALPSHTAQRLSVSEASGAPRAVAWRDPLPPDLLTGDLRALVYRVQLRNHAGRTAGWSRPAYTAAGAAPPPVAGLAAQGTRQGILLRWQPASPPGAEATSQTAPAPAEVLLRRSIIGAPAQPAASRRPSRSPRPPAVPTTLWLDAHAETPASGAATSQTLDASAALDTPYRYTAVRRRHVQLDGLFLEIRSAPSAPVEITLRDIFPPPAPTGLSAAAFSDAGHFAVDLVWEPVTDPDLAGYNITRQPLDPTGSPQAPPTRLNPTPVALPAFHDTTADPAARYRYNITAIDSHGNESTAATTLLEPRPPQ